MNTTDTCELCGAGFSTRQAAKTFDSKAPGLDYRHIHVTLCAGCALKAIRDRIEGVYGARCARCGRPFDLASETIAYDNDNTTPYAAVTHLCANCAAYYAARQLTTEIPKNR